MDEHRLSGRHFRVDGVAKRLDSSAARWAELKQFYITVHMAEFTHENPKIPPDIDRAVLRWMGDHGWDADPARRHMDPDGAFYVWQERESAQGRSHALWVEEAMVRHLSPEQLLQILDSEAVAEDIRISFKVRIEERGAEYRVSVVPRRSGEFRKEDLPGP